MQFTPFISPPQFCASKNIFSYARKKGLDFREAIISLLDLNIWPEELRRNYGLLSCAKQAALLKMPIFIAGCGGLGEEVAAMLVRMGAGQLFLCDHDIFEESNLNRQIFCSIKTLGLSKAEVTAKALGEIAPWGEYYAIKQKLERGNILPLLGDSAIVIDCLDSVQAKKMLEQAVMLKGCAWLHGSVLQFEGFACIKSRACDTLGHLYPTDFYESGAGSVLAYVVTGTAALMCALFRRWLDNPDYSSPVVYCDYSIPEIDRFQTDHPDYSA